MRGTIPPLLQYVFIAQCLVKHRDFTFTFTFTFKLLKTLTMPITTPPGHEPHSLNWHGITITHKEQSLIWSLFESSGVAV
jgi:hypothetical protein